MSKFKIGDKVLRVDSYVWNYDDGYMQKGKNYIIAEVHSDRVRVEGCPTWYSEMGFELVGKELAEATPTPHVHHDMIVEWAKDPTRIVQFYDDEYYDCGWKDVVGQPPMWHTDKQYRFKPVEPERVFPTTSLTDDELEDIVCQGDTYMSVEDYRNIANAAIKRYILDLEGESK